MFSSSQERGSIEDLNVIWIFHSEDMSLFLAEIFIHWVIDIHLTIRYHFSFIILAIKKKVELIFKYNLAMDSVYIGQGIYFFFFQ